MIPQLETQKNKKCNILTTGKVSTYIGTFKEASHIMSTVLALTMSILKCFLFLTLLSRENKLGMKVDTE